MNYTKLNERIMSVLLSIDIVVYIIKEIKKRDRTIENETKRRERDEIEKGNCVLLFAS